MIMMIINNGGDNDDHNVELVPEKPANLDVCSVSAISCSFLALIDICIEFDRQRQRRTA